MSCLDAEPATIVGHCQASVNLKPFWTQTINNEKVTFSHGHSFKNVPAPEMVERVPQPDLLEKIKSGKVVEVTELSSSEDVEISRVPSPLPFQKKCSKDNIDLDYVSSCYLSFYLLGAHCD